MQAKALVCYFSASGQTARLATTLAQSLDADIFEIRPAQPYTRQDLNWNDSSSRSSIEMKDPDARPALLGPVPDISGYDVVFIGFPIWWYVAPRIIQTFLESCDLRGKTVVPFATSGGSGMGRTDEVLHACCDAETAWRPGRRFAVQEKPDVLRAWVNGLNL